MPKSQSEIGLFPIDPNRQEDYAPPFCSTLSSGFLTTANNKLPSATVSELISLSALVVSTAQLLSTMPRDEFELAAAINVNKVRFDDPSSSMIRWNEPVFHENVVSALAVLSLERSQDGTGAAPDETADVVKVTDIDRLALRLDGGLSGCSYEVDSSPKATLVSSLEANLFPSKEPNFENAATVGTVPSSSSEISSDDDDGSEFDGSDCRFELFDDVSILTAESGMESVDDERRGPGDSDCLYESFDDVSVLTADSGSSDAKGDGEDKDATPSESTLDMGADLELLQNMDDSAQYLEPESLDSAPGEDTASQSSIDAPIDELQVDLKFLDEESPCPLTNYATDDFRLMSFLLDFCAEGRTRG